jgi:hypothetical protein
LWIFLSQIYLKTNTSSKPGTFSCTYSRLRTWSHCIRAKHWSRGACKLQHSVQSRWCLSGWLLRRGCRCTTGPSRCPCWPRRRRSGPDSARGSQRCSSACLETFPLVRTASGLWIILVKETNAQHFGPI